MATTTGGLMVVGGSTINYARLVGCLSSLISVYLVVYNGCSTIILADSLIIVVA